MTAELHLAVNTVQTRLRSIFTELDLVPDGREHRRVLAVLRFLRTWPGNPQTKVINVVGLSGKKAPANGELNEHVWYDFPTVLKLSGAVETFLSGADPAGAATYSANAKAFAAQLAGLQAQEKRIRSAHAGDGVAITEPVPLYLLDAAGLVNRTPERFSEAVEDGTDVPVPVLNQALHLLRSHAVKLLAFNEQTVGPQTEKILARARADRVPGRAGHRDPAGRPGLRQRAAREVLPHPRRPLPRRTASHRVVRQTTRRPAARIPCSGTPSAERAN